MSKQTGIIYEMGEGRFGIAYHHQQLDEFKRINKIYLHVFLDRGCNIPERHPESGKKIVTLKAIDKLKAIGFTD